MSVARCIKTGHKDLIHDVAYDFYGTRMATCSSDQTVQVWDCDPSSGNWTCTASWKAHSGSAWKVTWSNPEFGQVIATCSFDRTAVVWEEVVGEGNVGEEGSSSHWVKRTTLVDSRTSVTDVKFAPKCLGLVLSTCSADGCVRIYEAPDVMNLTQWSLQYEISVKISCSCISWNPTFRRTFTPMLAVGSDDSTQDTTKVMIYVFNESARKWSRIENIFEDVTDPVNDIAFAPNLGRSFHMLGIASKDVKIMALEPPNEYDMEGDDPHDSKVTTLAQLVDHKSTVWRVAWNVTGTILATSGDDGCIRLWKGNYMGNWKCISTLKGEGLTMEMATENSSSTAHTGSNPEIGSRFVKVGSSGNIKEPLRY